ncbi:hypothetical protein BEL04_19490 [Mucilaginibacter sp. PPCGB 2223]|uniref:multinuclear nonheme iron-dependent oxidase n=1 Tax=Mucilaginibacter sp. PPCGB 2223 TaxID=1886027 RepID=UPI00082656CE|nr:DUF692 family multinuclear iron-containing protein [Mucilaginibacter sp. PPCGB 2223]OCX50908.1 hypothetical protein BEL04_19490 [Mucilaginibacter sp. PPCGB 2223]
MKYAIGTTYEGKDFDYLQEIIPYVKHIEVSPDSISAYNQGRVTINESSLQHLLWMQENSDADLLLHGVGLSIGSYDGYSKDYINILSELFSNLAVKWHSEHLAYTMVNGENLGTMLTLPHTDEVITMVCRRIDAIQSKFKVPFLMENVISMLPNPDEQYNEAQFLNKITHLTGCGLILDVYNLQCDEKNFGLNLDGFFDELDLDPVHELHLAGGLYDTEYDFQMDIHAHLTAGSTIALAQTITRKQPKNLQNITFEILEEFIPQVGTTKIIAHLKLLDTLFN